MSAKTEISSKAEQLWRTYMTTGDTPDFADMVWFERKFLRPLARALPSEPRCRICYYPFKGLGGMLVRSVMRLEPSKMHPELCNVCERVAQKYPGGAEVEMSLLFADVRGSTEISQNMSPSEYGHLIDHFYKSTTRELFKYNAMVEKLIGDEVNGFFVPGFAGNEHACAAVEAGQAILRAVGYGTPDGPWIPVGVGIHTGVAFVGAVSSEGGSADIAVLGEEVNTAARIAAKAGPGELVFSQATRQAAGMPVEGLEKRSLDLKGIPEPVQVWVK